MESNKGFFTGFKNIKRDARSYIEKRIQLVIMTVGEKLAAIVADNTQRIAGVVLLMGGFWIAWFALCFFISDLIGNLALGFLIGSLPLFLIGFVFVKLKPQAITRNIQANIKQEILSALDNMNGKHKVEEEEPKA